jgi:catechol 2,3-dioxygenase-like lactoylglutathione lyase family enzyme
MSTTQQSTTRFTGAASATDLPYRLEGVVIPVTDFDRAKEFYLGLGWRLDADVDAADGYRLMQVTPPGSQASVLFGTRVTSAAPGSSDGLLLVVDDIDDARGALLARGIQVSEVFHDSDGGLGGGFHIGDAGRTPGHDPERRSYASYASFHDPDGNRWVLQEITTRLPGRLWERGGEEVAALAQLLHETAERHDAFEKVAAPHDWWDWYAAYLDARLQARTPDEAARDARRHMAELKRVDIA